MRERRLAGLIIVLALGLHLPSLWWGFFADDYGHQIILRGLADHASMRPWNLYNFGTFPTEDDPNFEIGAFPWWTSRDFKIRFFRPLTSLTLWLDHTLFGSKAVGYHLSSLLWYALLLLLTYRLYRALGLPPRAALLALCLFGASASHVFSVGWPANRNSLITVALTVAAVLALSQYARRGRLTALSAGLALALLAALAKESGITAFGLLVLYLFFLHRRAGDAPLRRWATTGVCLALLLAVAYLAGLLIMGYGTTGVFYSPPWVDPTAFLKRAGLMIALSPAALTGLGSVDMVGLHPELLPVSLGLSAVVVVLAVNLRREIPPHPWSGFLLAWTVLAIIPQGSVVPSDRLLLGASVAAAALLGLFIADMMFSRPTVPPSKLARFSAVGILITAGCLSAAAVVVQGVLMAKISSATRHIVLATPVGGPELGRREVFLLQTPTALVGFNILSTWGCERADHELRFWPMQLGRRAVRWTRIDEHSFEIESQDAPFLSDVFESVFLADRTVPPVGAQFRTALFTVEVTALALGGVRAFRVRCPDSLDAARYRFCLARQGQFALIDPPPVGQSVLIESATRPAWLVP